MISSLKKIIRAAGLRNVGKRIIKKVNLSGSITVKGSSIRTPIIYGIVCSIEEPWMADILAILLKKKNGAFIDVGVNVGQTLVQMKAIDRDRQYIGFEPNPSCIFYVENLISVNSFSNCTLVPAGLHIENTIMVLDIFSDDQTNSGGSLVEGFRADRKNNRVHKRILVPVYSFETATHGIKWDAISVIKIDVEGGELEVFKSLTKCIADFQPYILLEVLPAYSSDNTLRLCRQNELLQLVKDVRYTIYRLKKHATGKFKGVELVNDFGIHANLQDCDYLLLPPGISIEAFGELNTSKSK